MLITFFSYFASTARGFFFIKVAISRYLANCNVSHANSYGNYCKNKNSKLVKGSYWRNVRRVPSFCRDFRGEKRVNLVAMFVAVSNTSGVVRSKRFPSRVGSRLKFDTRTGITGSESRFREFSALSKHRYDAIYCWAPN